ncbi:MAG: alpha/beta hydrolase [Rhodospirillaceae bacterium]|jgi:acetyl esterase|nr:alpha/beta hydrolase [Rhodospirillaceae bacterium]MBT3493071.1 alpha/beta hydrolase [Rhodospirillaceae bacterium]MBT3779448.1 alpha/beta hydrolase [Rhodospirillaceae bacterium]MBT3977161.1 alpha/beta hydrolase [Rhodospirillaceae bacterium]MBT4171309.1 alpha/beta hydrolase [Rhodospirillaceae bacterium]
MAVDGDIQKILDLIKQAGRPPYREQTLEEARAGYQVMVNLMDPEEEPIHRSQDRSIPGPAGEIPVRVYWPREAGSGETLGVFIYLHGGGFVIGDLDTHDPLCRRLCNRGDCIVVSVDYRLAPEHPFPASGEDCIAAMNWCAANAAELGGDPSRLAIGGDSAGGNLSAVCALAARDADGPDLRLQLLIYPGVAPHQDSQSHAAFAEGYVLTRDNIAWFMEQYTGGRDLSTDPNFAPTIAADHGGQAPAEIIVAGYDPLRDEGMAYAEALSAAGVPTNLVNYEGAVHAFMQYYGASSACREAVEHCGSVLKTALAPA